MHGDIRRAERNRHDGDDTQCQPSRGDRTELLAERQPNNYGHRRSHYRGNGRDEAHRGSLHTAVQSEYPNRPADPRDSSPDIVSPITLTAEPGNEHKQKHAAGQEAQSGDAMW